MSEIRYRLAKPSDAKEIATVQLHVKDRYNEGISLALGKRYLTAYYKIILNDPWEVVICAVNESGEIVGFISDSLNAKERFENIRKHRLTLGFAAMTSLILHPSLIKDVWQRYKSLNNKNSKEKFVHTEGVRIGYWCWLKSDDSLKSVELNQLNAEFLRLLGVKEIYFEVDKFNKAVYKYNLKIAKAEPVEEITLPDGRVRVLFRLRIG